MREFARPRVVVSRCLGFDRCRYDGSIIPDPFVSLLKSFVDFLPVCPEVEIGLGVPRPPLRLVKDGDKARLVQPETGMDLTEPMLLFARRFLKGLGEVDGFILKNRSPSCALQDAKIYASVNYGAAIGRRPGLFAEEVKKALPYFPIEEEGRLTNPHIRHHFLTRIFALAELRGVRELGGLVEFHTRYKFVIMAQGQHHLKDLGRIVANPQRLPFPMVFPAYKERFLKALALLPRRGSVVNALEHAFAFVSSSLSPKEKQYFGEVLQQYLAGKWPLSVPLSLLRSWAIRFQVEYLLTQRFFSPYPEALVPVSETP